MKLRVIQDHNTKKIINWVKEMGEFDDWDLLFDDIPESGLLNSLTFEEIFAKSSCLKSQKHYVAVGREKNEDDVGYVY